MTEYLPGVVLATDRYKCSLFVPAYCVLKKCRRANACLGSEGGPCLADERKEGVFARRFHESLRHLKVHGKMPTWFSPPHVKEPETDQTRAEDHAFRVEFITRLWNAYRQIKAYPETRNKLSKTVLLLLEMIDFSKIHDPNPIPRFEERVGKAACDTHTTQPAAPVLSEPRIRTIRLNENDHTP